MRWVPSILELVFRTLHSQSKPQQPIKSRKAKLVRLEFFGFLQYQNLHGKLFTLDRSHNSLQKVGEPSRLGQNASGSFNIKTCVENSSLLVEATIASRKQRAKSVRSKCIMFLWYHYFCGELLLSVEATIARRKQESQDSQVRIHRVPSISEPA